MIERTDKHGVWGSNDGVGWTLITPSDWHLSRPLPIPLPPQPLDPTGALATLLAVLEVATVQDAANAVGLTPDDLIAEAQAWEAARL
jgi:hypothetical protein